jgi:hypothetical protein
MIGTWVIIMIHEKIGNWASSWNIGNTTPILHIYCKSKSKWITEQVLLDSDVAGINYYKSY